MNKIYLLPLFTIILSANIFAHSGRTDSRGGHWDRSTNTYHFHNSGTVKAKVSPAKAKVSPAKAKVSPAKAKVSPAKAKVSPAKLKNILFKVKSSS